MFVIDKHNKILLTKGDTASIYVEVYDLDNKKYEIQSTDEIKLTVKKNGSPAAAITKTANAEHYIVILPNDTSSLTPGLYVYDVQLKTVDGYTYTIIPTSFFELGQEVSE